MSVEWLSQILRERRSVRAFEPEPVDRAELAALFADAQQAPSWCNIQPWLVRVTGGALTATISEALLEAAGSGMPNPDLGYPLEYPEPYKARRRDCGVSLYAAMGIARDDRQGRLNAWLRNYELFDAPHLAVVSRDSRLGEYATLDVGVWLGFLFAAAAARGIAMCAMASIAAYPAPLRSHLDIPDSEKILFGITLGRERRDAAANRGRTTREDAAEWVSFVGFDT
jgi:nitroreductase